MPPPAPRLPPGLFPNEERPLTGTNDLPPPEADVPSPSTAPSSASSSGSNASTATGASTPPSLDCPTVAQRAVQRDLTPEEMWSAWPTLSKSQVAMAKQGRMPFEIVPYSDNAELYGNIIAIDATPSIHPPRRTAYLRTSAWTLAKQHLDRGMHLSLIKELYELCYGAGYEPKWAAIWSMLQAWNPQWSVRQARVEDAKARAIRHIKAGKKLDAMGELANAWLYTLPWYPEAGASDDQQCRAACRLAFGILSLIARTAAMVTLDYDSRICKNELERLARIGFTAAKAVIWRADLCTINQVRVACNAADLLDTVIATSDDQTHEKEQRRQLVLQWVEQAKRICLFNGKDSFTDVPDDLRTEFFRFNFRNEHYCW